MFKNYSNKLLNYTIEDIFLLNLDIILIAEQQIKNEKRNTNLHIISNDKIIGCYTDFAVHRLFITQTILCHIGFKPTTNICFNV